ncbi:hypothetical protein WMY93_017837 [Mugilogobius chulae]|uniref:Uncharacterized protein n=1 Tax=Mugilogobius chulae TaxID=88201 RepID=A0AAW0NZK2_9GOBI
MNTRDYREDGMDLGSDVSSRSSSESNSNKVTPCSPSIDLAALEDYEEDEDYQHYKKKVIEEWESEYRDNYSSSQHPGPEEGGGGGDGVDDDDGSYTKTVNSHSLQDELHDMKTVPTSLTPSGHTASSDSSPEELKQNGNVIVPRNSQLQPLGAGQEGTETSSQRSSGQARVSRYARSAAETGAHTKRYRQDPGVEEEPLPTMDWAALERHLAGLQCREEENQNLNHYYNYTTGKTNYTSAPSVSSRHVRNAGEECGVRGGGTRRKKILRNNQGCNLFVSVTGGDVDADADHSFCGWRPGRGHEGRPVCNFALINSGGTWHGGAPGNLKHSGDSPEVRKREGHFPCMAVLKPTQSTHPDLPCHTIQNSLWQEADAVDAFTYRK